VNQNPAPIAKPPRSPVFYIALGCGLMVLLMVLGVAGACGGCLLLGRSVGKGFVDDTQKAENVKKFLGKAPQGYYPVIAVSVPMMMDQAILIDAPLVADAGPPVFTKAIQYWRIIENENSKQMREYFDGKTDNTEVFPRNMVPVDVKDVIGKGVVKTGDGATVKYVATRGHISADFDRGSNPLRYNTLMGIECPGADGSVRVMIWSEKDPHPDKPAEEVDPKGTVLEESAIGSLVQQITPCTK
jgi:hypothetical protein